MWNKGTGGIRDREDGVRAVFDRHKHDYTNMIQTIFLRERWLITAKFSDKKSGRHAAEKTNKSYLPINVLPVPGGPKSKIPFGGPRRPLKMSLNRK